MASESSSGSLVSRAAYPTVIELPAAKGGAATIRAELAKLPPKTLARLTRGRVTFIAVARSITEYYPHRTSREIRPGTPYKSLKGHYFPATRTAVVVTSRMMAGTPRSVVLHEAGHAYDHLAGWQSVNSGAFRAAHARDRSKFNNRHYRDSPHEAYAASFAMHHSGNKTFPKLFPNYSRYAAAKH